MFSLLLLFLMTTIDFPSEPVQVVPVSTPVVQEFWRTTRPLNQRTQVMNTYLDSATYDGQHSIASAGSETLDGSVVRTNIGKINFDYAGWFTTPTNSTYTITLSSFVWWAFVPTSWVIIISILHKDKDWNTINRVPVAIPREACDWDGNAWTYTYPFNKWDTITFSARNWTDETLVVRIIATITKQS